MGRITTLFGGETPPGTENIIGEDTVDLLRAIEGAFQIQFGEDGPFPRTVGELCDRIVAMARGMRSNKCLTLITFYKVRRAIMSVVGVSRDRVTPSAHLASILALGPSRRRQWRDLEWKTGLRFPALAHPDSMTGGLLLLAVGLALWVSADGWTTRPLPASLFSSLWSVLLALILWLVALAMTHRIVWAFPRRCETVGDLTRIVLAKNYGTLADEAGGWNESEIWTALRELIAEEISFDKDSILKETAFPEGLKIY